MAVSPSFVPLTTLPAAATLPAPKTLPRARLQGPATFVAPATLVAPDTVVAPAREVPPPTIWACWVLEGKEHNRAASSPVSALSNRLFLSLISVSFLQFNRCDATNFERGM